VYDTAETIAATAVPLNDARIAPEMKRSVLVLLSAVALLHLLACANVTSLLLGRAAARRREVAIRLALGCAQARLRRQLLAEGLVIVAMAGSLGTFLAWQACALVTVPAALMGPRNFYGSLAPFSQPAGGWRLAVAGIVATALTALLVAWAPAVSALRVSVTGGLRESARGVVRGAATLRRFSARGAVVATEAALAVMLLVGGGLMIETWSRIRGTTLGIEPDHVLTFWVRPPEVQVSTAAAPAFVSRVLEAITRVPGVVSATVDGGAPVSGTARSVLFVAGRPAPALRDAPPVLRHYVAPDHFRTLGIPVVRGRVFNAGDAAGQPRVAVISETAARRFWPGEDPIGQRVWFGGGSSFDRPDSAATIVGIVGDVVYEPIDQQPNRSSFYTPYAQFTYVQRAYFVRTSGDPLGMVGAIRRAVRSVDPALPLFEVRTLNDLIGSSWARHTFDAMLFGAFAAAALLLAASGIFAVVAYSVAERTREMGIRLALGATPVAVVRQVLREGLALPFIGLAVGVAASLALTRLLRASLYEVTATDPAVFVAAVVLLTLAAALACLIPALRATRVDPLEALRAE
jgi:putative ABC transport system permease protein